MLKDILLKKYIHTIPFNIFVKFLLILRRQLLKYEN